MKKKIIKFIILFLFILCFLFVYFTYYNYDSYMFSKGKKYYEKHKYQKAINLFKDLNERQPENCDYLKYLASSYEQVGKYSLAVQSYRSLIEISTSQQINLGGIPHYSLAKLYNKNREYKKAITFLNKGLEQVEKKFKGSTGLFKIQSMFFNEIAISYEGLNLAEESKKYRKMAESVSNRYSEEVKRTENLIKRK